MKKHKVVLFLEQNARILTLSDPEPYRGIPYCVIDPDLSAVKAHPPHYWQLIDGKVIPISNEEKIKRDAAHHLWGEQSQNDFIFKVRVAINEERAKYVEHIRAVQKKYMLAGVAAALLVTLIIKMI